MPHRPRLAGVPERASRPFEQDRANAHDAFVKLRLGHSAIGSVIVPEQIFVENDGRWQFHQISFFGPPRLLFNVEPGLHFAMFNVDVGEPRTTLPIRCVVTIRSDEGVLRYSNGAQLYRCTVEAPAEWLDQPSGSAILLPDNDYALELFHITNEDAARNIRASEEIWSSAWNLQGTRKLKNVAYVYLTSLPNIRTDRDLLRIAMASDGMIHFQTTSERPFERVLSLEVYRESTTGRTESLSVSIPSSLVSPPHLLIHQTPDEAYYEVIGPEIYRVGLKPGTSLTYADRRGSTEPNFLKHFSYIVVGNAAETLGLAAPYDEEETEQIMHLELLEDTDLFDFWLSHANSDQTTWRSIEPREFE